MKETKVQMLLYRMLILIVTMHNSLFSNTVIACRSSNHFVRFSGKRRVPQSSCYDRVTNHLVAFLLGCRRHKDRTVFVLGSLGLVTLVLAAYFGNDLLGELGEKVSTIIGGTILAFAHIRNYRLCRHNKCNT